MFDITKLALKIPNFLTNKECDELINEFEQRKEESLFESSNDIRVDKIKTSNYKVVPLQPNTNNFNLIKEKTNKVINIYIDYLEKPKYFHTESLKKCLNYSHKYRIMKYETGAKIHPHTDYRPHTYGSITFNLNDGYEGGEFKFFNGNYTIPLGKGDALIFPADFFWVHEVTSVTEGYRYSVNSFISEFSDDVLYKLSTIVPNMQDSYLRNTPQEELLGPYN